MGMEKLSIYLPAETLLEVQEAARKNDRSMSWILRRAWNIARGYIDDRHCDSLHDPRGTEAEGEGEEGERARQPIPYAEGNKEV